MDEHIPHHRLDPEMMLSLHLNEDDDSVSSKADPYDSNRYDSNHYDSEHYDLDLWQQAQDRVLLYLKMLGMPPLSSLDITREALWKAKEAAVENRTDPPACLAMRALNAILTEGDAVKQAAYRAYPILYHRFQGPGVFANNPANRPAAERSGRSRDLSASPPLNRTSMNSKKMVPVPFLPTALKRFFQSLRKIW